MRSILITIIALVSFTANAAPVTIDFEEFAIGQGGIASGGYQFSGGGGSGAVCPCEWTSAAVVNGNSGSKSWGASFFFPGLDSFGSGSYVVMQKTDGGAFAIHDLDLFFQTDSYGGYTSIVGTLAGGGAANLSVAVGTGDWLNLKEIQFTAYGDGFGLGGQTIVQIDNVVVSAVPVPAAVWLLGSALLSLGWLRRKQTA